MQSISDTINVIFGKVKLSDFQHSFIPIIGIELNNEHLEFFFLYKLSALLLLNIKLSFLHKC